MIPCSLPECPHVVAIIEESLPAKKEPLYFCCPDHQVAYEEGPRCEYAEPTTGEKCNKVAAHIFKKNGEFIVLENCVQHRPKLKLKGSARSYRATPHATAMRRLRSGVNPVENRQLPKM